MTVSPRWPQDNTPTPLGADDGVAATDSSVPPTLLRLPNLNQVPPASPAQNPVAQNPFVADLNVQNLNEQHRLGHANAPAAGMPNQLVPNNGLPTSPVNQPVLNQPAADTAAGVASPIAGYEQSTDQHRMAQQPSEQSFNCLEYPNVSDPFSDAPTGRSWMEVAQQHGVVVLLLMVVVATAVFTGRKTSIEGQGASIADGIDLSSIDEGMAADIPWSSHTHDLNSGIVSTPQAAVVPEPNGGRFAERPDDAVTNSVDSAASVASLEPPQKMTQAKSVALHDSQQSSPTENQFSRQFDAKTVSNRFVPATDANSDVAFNPPSLEVLANSLPDSETFTAPGAGVDPSTGSQFNSLVPISSKTPNGINDWMQYLPELTPSTSN